MNFFKRDKIMDRLGKMIDNAMDGKPVESDFDETKMSALETKLSHYLAMTGTSRRQLTQEKEHVNQLISDISHQAKTPIANILLYSQLLEESGLSEEGRNLAQSLTEQAEKLNFLIASLIKASRLETGIISLTPEPQQLQPLLELALREISAKAERKNISITCQIPAICAVYDLKWSSEAVYNILDNAIKYTPAGGAVSISADAYQLFCRIDIADNGPGISEYELPRIFSRFYRSAAAAQEEGVGIGLYLAREIITKQGGYIKACSELGKGSCFSVFLPMNG